MVGNYCPQQAAGGLQMSITILFAGEEMIPSVSGHESGVKWGCKWGHAAAVSAQECDSVLTNCNHTSLVRTESHSYGCVWKFEHLEPPSYSSNEQKVIQLLLLLFLDILQEIRFVFPFLFYFFFFAEIRSINKETTFCNFCFLV